MKSNKISNKTCTVRRKIVKNYSKLYKSVILIVLQAASFPRAGEQQLNLLF